MYLKKVEKEREFQRENSLNKMEKTNIEVEFRIIGENFDIAEVTRNLNILPTEFWKIGDKIRNTKKVRTYTSWNYSTEKKETLFLEEQLDAIGKIFIPRLETLCNLKEKYNLDFSLDVIVIIENSEVPSITFDDNLISFLSKLKARIDVDTYIN